MTDSIPWIEKYRPKKLDDMRHDKNLLDLFQNSIKTGKLTHFLFYGPPGTGKTSAIHAIGREIFKEFFPTRLIEFNASDDRGINAVREKITNEAKKYVTEAVSMDGSQIPPYKIIVLDEADSMTDEAQDALRVIIEQYSGVTRFCFICNYISKITDAIKSRCATIYFKKLSNECMVDKLNEISLREDMDLGEKILNVIIDVSNGDMRKAIMLLQNVKYLYNFKHSIKKPIFEMGLNELKVLSSIDHASKINPQITQKDIYHVAASIDLETAHQIINEAIACPSILGINILSKKIISNGYPIDNILFQLNKAILQNEKLHREMQAKIIKYSGGIFLKIKECSNEYIQLLDYLACVRGVYTGSLAYD